MIGQTSTGKSFGGLVAYVLDEKENRKQAEILGADGLNTIDQKTITNDFNVMRKQNQSLGKAVWHTSISFDEGDNLSNEEMKEIAEDFIKEMGLENTQHLIVKHNDTKHKHLHIIANRVDYHGKSISDSHSMRKTKSTCQSLEKKYGLVKAEEKENKRKKEIKETIVQGIDQGKDFAGIEKDIEKLGYSVKYSTTPLKEGGERINGVRYIDEEKGITFKASEIHRDLSYGKMIKAIDEKKEKGKKQKKEQDKSKNISTKQTFNQEKKGGMIR